MVVSTPLNSGTAINVSRALDQGVSSLSAFGLFLLSDNETPWPVREDFTRRG